MKILSLDVSTTSTGFAVINNGLVKEYGTFSYTNSDFVLRCQRMADYLSEVLEKHSDIEKVVIEELKVGKNTATVAKLAIAQGVLLRELKGIHTTFVGPTVWRRHFGINDKREEAKLKALKLVDKLGYVVKNDDEAEAILLGLFFSLKMA